MYNVLFMKRTFAEMPLHYGKAPRWLFERQKKILFEICRLVILEFGTAKLLEKLADPVWFQILGCISGFDWHSSGVTTTVTGALKEVFEKNPEYGISVFGGKGKSAIDTPNQILSSKITNPLDFIQISKLTARVDSVCVQDGYELYHHTIFIDSESNWAVVQQGMNLKTLLARRYHWFNKISAKQNFSSKLLETKEIISSETILEPHSGISAQKKEEVVINLVDDNCENLQKNIVKYINEEKPEKVILTLRKILEEVRDNKFSLFDNVHNLCEKNNIESGRNLKMPLRHYITQQDISDKSSIDLHKIYEKVCRIKDAQVKKFSDLVLFQGVGQKTLRALCLISEVVFGDMVSLTDPARFSFAFGGKDGHPYPVDRENYDKTISLLKFFVDKAKLADREKISVMRRLAKLKTTT